MPTLRQRRATEAELRRKYPTLKRVTVTKPDGKAQQMASNPLHPAQQAQLEELAIRDGITWEEELLRAVAWYVEMAEEMPDGEWRELLEQRA